MSSEKYDQASPESILAFAMNLTGKSLAEAVDLPEVNENVKNKGDLGSMVELYYFEIELKWTPILGQPVSRLKS